jgi:TPR repeat protein
MELGKYLKSNVDKEIQQFIDWQKTERTRAEYLRILDYYDELIPTDANAKVAKAFVMIFMDESMLYSGLELLERAIYDDKVETATGSWELYVRYSRIQTENAYAKSLYFLANAASLEHPIAQLLVYEKYYDGELKDMISKDLADKMLIRSAENKNLSALKTLCSMLNNDLEALDTYGYYAKLLADVSPKEDNYYQDYLKQKTMVDGVQAYMDKDYDEAFKLLDSIFEELNHPIALIYYAKMLYYGWGTAKNQESAIKLAEILSKVSAEEASLESLYMIAISYLEGIYYDRDINKGISILRDLDKLNFKPAKDELNNWKKGLFGWKRV